nr:hypothetical protein [Tanacetum cinerariifolium]
MMRKRPRNAQWTLGLSELVAFHIESCKLMSMVSVVDALRATIAGTNPRYPSRHKISQNGVNILNSIDEGPFQMGTVREPLAEGTGGAPHLEQRETIHDYYVQFAKLINDMRNIKMTMSKMQLNSKFMNNMLPEWSRFVTANRGQGTNPQGGGAAGYGRVQNRVGNANLGQARHVKCYNCNDAEQLLFLAGRQDNAIDDDVDEQPVQDILSEVQDHDHYQDAVCAHPEEHAMHDNVQLNHVVDSHVDYTSDSNMISYDQYVKANAVPVVHNNVSSVPNDAYMMIYNDMYEPHAQSDTLKIAEITRRKMNDKIKDPECVNHKVKIAPHDYSKDNFLATFTPQKQLTPEQIFWSQDLIKMKSEALKEQTTVSRPIKALTVKHDEIERKNLLIANDNLIVECLSKEVFSVATNFELNLARFTKKHVSNTIVEARCLELEAELSNLRDKSHNDNHDEAENDKIKQHYKELYDSIKITCAKHIEQVTALTTKNVNLKAQILDTVNSVSKEHVKPKVLTPEKYAIDVEPIVPHLRNNKEAHFNYLRHLKESVETIRYIVEEAKVVRPLDSSIVSACRYTKHSRELLEYAIDTCPQDSHPRDKTHAPAPLIRKKQVTFAA